MARKFAGQKVPIGIEGKHDNIKRPVKLEKMGTKSGPLLTAFKDRVMGGLGKK